MNQHKGVLVFARNNSQIDYIKQARFVAERAKKYLNLPTTVVTDSVSFLKTQYLDWQDMFDNVIGLVWDSEHLDNDSVLCAKELVSQKKFWDGSLVNKQLEWKNQSRALAYELSPYDETLVLDTDIIISNSEWLKCFDQSHDLLLYKNSIELVDIDRGDDFVRISDTSVDFYWATCVFFRKSQENKLFFDLVQHIQENWQHYNNIFQINSPYFRNDYAFSIAIHIMNGYQSGDFAKTPPGTLYFCSDKCILWNINDDSLLVLLEKPMYDGEYTPLRVKDLNLHFMNKFSLNRCLDEL
jgi:hypothetical protein